MATAELTRAIRDKRVAIAQDVIDRIDAKTVNVAHGGYMHVPLGRWNALVTSRIEEDMQAHVDELSASCTVCALGAVLLSKARLEDAVPMHVLEEGNYRERFQAALADVFDGGTLRRIESAFERIIMLADWPSTGADRLRGAVLFGLRFTDPAARCRAVMQSIVDNDGEFPCPSLDRDELESALQEDSNAAALRWTRHMPGA